MNSHQSNSRKTILSFPNEILHQIFSHILNSGKFRIKFQDENGNDHNLPQILVLRSISRRFRAIGNEADMWYDEEFDFAHLVFRRRFQKRKYEVCEGLFLKALLSDKEFVRCLGRKTAWRFSSLEGLFTILRDVPSFQQNARTIRLYEFRNGVFIAIDRLRACDHVTKISVSSPTEIGDLDLVANSCPFLEELALFGLDEDNGIGAT
jgi:hypothetical protein